MPINLPPIPPRIDEHATRADDLARVCVAHIEAMAAFYGQLADMLWRVPGYTVADAQAVLDAMPNGLPAQAGFLLHYLVGQALAALKHAMPGAIDVEILGGSPVPYTVTPEGRIVLDAGATYPGPERE